MKVYSVNCALYRAPDDERYFATLKEALQEARRVTKEADVDATVARDETVPGREGLLAALNQCGWRRNSKVIAVVTNGRARREIDDTVDEDAPA